MFIWNNHLTSPLPQNSKEWPTLLIHGFFSLKQFHIFGRIYTMIVIARRSNQYAGTRYLKRGISRTGYVANEVETEQILIDEDMRKAKRGVNVAFTSFVHHRGSIPIHWTQDVNNITPKPPLQSKKLIFIKIILVKYCDPYFGATILHFRDLFKRYGGPITILNLVKQSEKVKRECIVSDEFKKAIAYSRQYFNPDYIQYCAYDIAKASKT